MTVILAEGFEGDISNWMAEFDAVSIEQDTENHTEGTTSMKVNADVFKSTVSYSTAVNKNYFGDWSGVTDDWFLAYDVFVPQAILPAIGNAGFQFGDVVSGPNQFTWTCNFKPTSFGWSTFYGRLKWFGKSMSNPPLFYVDSITIDGNTIDDFNADIGGWYGGDTNTLLSLSSEQAIEGTSLKVEMDPLLFSYVQKDFASAMDLSQSRVLNISLFCIGENTKAQIYLQINKTGWVRWDFMPRRLSPEWNNLNIPLYAANGTEGTLPSPYPDCLKYVTGIRIRMGYEWTPDWSNIKQLRFTPNVNEQAVKDATSGTYYICFDNLRLLSPDEFVREVAPQVILSAAVVGGLTYLIRRK